MPREKPKCEDCEVELEGVAVALDEPIRYLECPQCHREYVVMEEE